MESQKKDHCYALVLGGGGTRGAYEAGVVWSFVHDAADPSEYAWDVLSGVSAGSVNGGAMAVFAPGDEFNMVKTLSETWQTLSTGKIFKLWNFVLVGGLTHTGMVNTQPLKDFMEKYFGEHGYEFKRKVAFAGVDANDGSYQIFNETLSDQEKVNGILTSAAIAFVFERIDWVFEGRQILGIDGGTGWGINIPSVIQRCHELVDDDSQITVDVVSCHTYGQLAYDGDDKTHAIHNYNRYIEIKDYHDSVATLFEVMQAFPKVNYRHYVEPSQTLSVMSMMDGTNATCTWPMQELGRLDGSHSMTKEGEMFKRFKEYNESEDLRRQWPRIGEYVDYVKKQQLEQRGPVEEINIGCTISFLLNQTQSEVSEDIIQQ